MKSTFEHIDGVFCLKTHDTFSDEPLAVIAHYPFGRFYLSDVEHLIGQPAVAMGNGVYACHVSGQCLEFVLQDGGSTKPIKFEKVQLEKPISNRQIRWHDGKWEKLFKSGWKAA